MPLPSYPINETLPPWMSQGYIGENGGFGIKLDARGGNLLSSLFYRFPPIQSASITVEAAAVFKSALSASANGYEGLTCQVRLLRVVNNNLDVIWNSNVLINGNLEDWAHQNTGENWIRRTWLVQPPDGLAPDFVDVAFIVKAPVGSVILSNAELRNSYVRRYPVYIEGPAQSGNNVVHEDYQTFVQGYQGQTSTVAFAGDRKVWYLSTVAMSARKGERVHIDYDAILRGVMTTANSVDAVVSLAIKWRKSNGEYVYETLDTISGLAGTPLDTGWQAIKDSFEFVAKDSYNQAEIIVIGRNIDTSNTGYSYVFEHRGIALNIKTVGSEDNG